MELMSTIRAREERHADESGDSQPTGLAGLHARISRRVKGR